MTHNNWLAMQITHNAGCWAWSELISWSIRYFSSCFRILLPESSCVTQNTRHVWNASFNCVLWWCRATKKSPMSPLPVAVQRRLEFVARRHQRDSNTMWKASFKLMQTYCRATAVACVKGALNSTAAVSLCAKSLTFSKNFSLICFILLCFSRVLRIFNFINAVAQPIVATSENITISIIIWTSKPKKF